jgi:hypothetical protein
MAIAIISMFCKIKKDFRSEIKFNKNFQQIITFYLFECPVDNKSCRGKSFDFYGISGVQGFAKLKKLLLSASNTLKNNYYPCKSSELVDVFNKYDYIEKGTEYCIFLKTDEKNIIQSLFAAIRNALAHGSFRCQKLNKEKYYYFENWHNYKKAEGLLKEETLIKWIEIIEKFQVKAED